MLPSTKAHSSSDLFITGFSSHNCSLHCRIEYLDDGNNVVFSSNNNKRARVLWFSQTGLQYQYHQTSINVELKFITYADTAAM